MKIQSVFRGKKARRNIEKEKEKMHFMEEEKDEIIKELCSNIEEK